MASQAHIIARQQLRLRCPNQADPMPLRRIAHTLCTETLPARLTQLFDRYDEPDSVWRIEKISVSLQLKEQGDLQEQLADAIIEQVEQQLRQQLSLRMEQALSLGGSLFEALQHYLTEGFLPWWALEKEAQDFQESVCRFLLHARSPGLSAQLRETLRNPHARRRFLALSPETVWGELLQESLPQEGAGWAGIEALLVLWLQEINPGRPSAVSPTMLRRLAFEIVCAASHKEHLSFALFFEKLAFAFLKMGTSFSATELDLLPLEPARKAFQILIPQVHSGHREKANREENTPAIQELPGEPFRQDDRQDKADARMLIANAGMVLLAPFLPAFFSRLNLVTSDRLTDVPRAVKLLRQLYTGASFEQMLCEHDLVLEKILCGLPLQESLEQNFDLSIAECEEAEALLQSVIQHWDALKNTTPDGLRYNFLHREGKLHFNGTEWKLRIQRQTHDILLDRLPWSISIIKLPWMKAWLSVDWTT